MKIITIEEARKGIQKAIDTNGGYSHNIVSLTLSIVSKSFGVKATNGLIEEFDLVDVYGIHPVTEEK